MAESCITRTPFASLIATIMCIIGVAVFLGTMYAAVDGTMGLAYQQFGSRVSWVDVLKFVMLAIGCGMGLMGFVLLLLGFLATGSTRDAVYKGSKSRTGGRCCLSFFMVVSYIMTICWLMITSWMCLNMSLFLIFWGFCKQDPEVRPGCLDLTQFHYMFRMFTKGRMNVCDQNLQNFCEKSDELYGLYIVAYVSSLVVLLSLVTFVICITANMTRIKTVQKMQELDDLKYIDEHSMETIS
ncbi:PREDICTED: neuronal membrane glycoprotein M6-a-like isoform X2 [Priapulus caudatus]|uniref:Neuronal membrane glycoprotein M6-a-like isoform X2 n=1 Tax=Priapulus caudatus TaxID=37621 RepID=A0ABM1EQ41_PRICU|nr:PREDICTED: neuronal membrane glycoprotein M6-a-like isoform X2 [Priapulus caudatus]